MQIPGLMQKAIKRSHTVSCLPRNVINFELIRQELVAFARKHRIEFKARCR